MTGKKEELFTVGAFAKLHHINKRTLQYYSEIGLFEPAHIGENGYRYYTYQQSMTLEILLTLRELDMPIEEIQAYMRKRSPEGLLEIITQQKKKICETRKRLDEINQLLERSGRLIERSLSVDLEQVSIILCEPEWLLCGRQIADTEEDFLKAFVEHTQSVEGPRLYNRIYGSMISLEKVLSGNYNDDDCFYTKIIEPGKEKGLFRKPGGRYVRGYSRGDWDKLPEAFERMLSFAKEREFTLTGFAYEEGINEMTIRDMKEYIVQIDILIQENQDFHGK